MFAQYLHKLHKRHNTKRNQTHNETYYQTFCLILYILSFQKNIILSSLIPKKYFELFLRIRLEFASSFKKWQ